MGQESFGMPEMELSVMQRTLAAERRHLEELREQLKKDQREFERKKELEEQRLYQEKRLFETKWKILEEETIRLAEDKAKLEQMRAFYERVRSYEAQQEEEDEEVVLDGDKFFTGVHTELALKRRYRELIKIYHPDNMDGDTATIQEINRQYDYLKQQLG